MSQLTIQGLTFDVPTPYAEGHPLTAVEASTLNQTFAENLRNNFSKTVAKAKEEAEKARGEKAELTSDEITQLQTDFATYAAEYKFAGRSAPRTPVDPVLREANKMARELITAALKAQDIKVANLEDGQMDDLIEQLLADNPEIKVEAQTRIDKAKTMAAGIQLGTVKTKPAEAPAAA